MYQYMLILTLTLYGITLVLSKDIKCEKNEVHSDCATPCPPTCNEPNKTCVLKCNEGCICINGFIRKTYPGPCVPKSNCKKCGLNQEWQSCSDNACRKTCQNRNEVIACPLVCRPGCSCKKGFVWTEDYTKCIPVKQCPKCGPNQVWQRCSDNSCRRTCENRNKALACILICRPGCSCQEGFVWTADYSKCIPIDKCPPSECGVNQIWEQCSDNACKRTCNNRDKIVKCPLICLPGCSCKDGYLWNKNLSQCIPIDSCPKECDSNQIWEQCSDNACKRTCANKNDNIICPAICIEGCSCKLGYVWNNQLTSCIPVDSCPNQCGKNQIWEECSDNACKSTCENWNIIRACPLICISGCSCKNGTVWNAELTECIPVQDCPQKCGSHQVWEACSDILCKKTCKQINGPNQCPLACIPGCSCQKDYVWNEDATECIPKSQCDVCGVHQHWRECSDKNCRRTCKNINDDNFVCNTLCIPGCSCNPGYVWNDQETECILPCKCQKQNCGDKEEWSECANYDCKPTCQRQLKKPCFNCIPGCVCKEGFIWDEHLKQCVLPFECTPACGVNEEYEVCSDINCRITCKNVNFTTPPICDKRCVPGCSCATGFIWNEIEQMCISPNDCPLKCKENEEWSSCTSPCERTCQGLSHKICLAVCIPGCKCIKGYLFDKYQNKCVAVSDCSKICDDNKEWCRYVLPSQITCQNLLYPRCHWSDVFQEVLFPGCICPSGSILDENTNKCVSLNQCLK